MSVGVDLWAGSGLLVKRNHCSTVKSLEKRVPGSKFGRGPCRYKGEVEIKIQWSSWCSTVDSGEEACRRGVPPTVLPLGVASLPQIPPSRSGLAKWPSASDSSHPLLHTEQLLLMKQMQANYISLRPWCYWTSNVNSKHDPIINCAPWNGSRVTSISCWYSVYHCSPDSHFIAITENVFGIIFSMKIPLFPKDKEIKWRCHTF